MAVCEICGNEIAPGSLECCFCGGKQTRVEEGGSVRFQCKTVNLKYGRPSLESAMRRLALEIDIARNERISVLVLIHGYGSSGEGGVIREECRKILDQLRSTKAIRDYIPGDGGAKSGPMRSLLRRYPLLRRDRELMSPNPGLTIVIL